MKYRLLLLAAAILFSTGGAALKANTLTAWQVACFRSGVAAIALLVLLPASRRNWSWRLIPAATAYAFVLILFALASRRTTAANAIFLQSLAPAYLMLLGPLVLKEPIKRSDLLLLAGMAIGFGLCFAAPQPTTHSAPDPALGNILALFAGFAWALTITGLRWLGRTETSGNTPAAAVLLGNVIAFAGALPIALPVAQVGLGDVAGLLYLGIFQIGLAYTCLTLAIHRVPAFEAAVLLMLETALNPAWAWLLMNENPGQWVILGGAVIVSSTILNTWWQARTSVS